MILAVAVAGCAPRSNRPADSSNSVNVLVENSTTSFVTVWAMSSGGGRQRVGDVPANRTVTLQFRPMISYTYNLVAEQISGTPIAVSNPVTPRPGETIRWSLRSNIATVGN
jgi:hypothetical protein